MWFLLALSLPLSVFGAQSQVQLYKTDTSPNQYYFTKPFSGPRTFNLKEGHDVFSPTNLVELPRPGVGVPNPSGDLLLIHVTTYSAEERRCDKYDSRSLIPLTFLTIHKESQSCSHSIY